MTTRTQNPPREIQISQKMSLGGASWLMALMIGLSRLTGFGRMMLVSHLYGNGPQTAAFEAAFNIPDTITILIAGGALATGFVPVFTELLARGDQEGARRTFRAMGTLLGAAFGLVTIALFALTFTPFIRRFAPEDFDAVTFALYLKLLRILLAAQFFFVIGGLFSGTLNALRLFWYPALQPVMFNGGIIVFGIALPYFFGMGIESQAWGALCGAIVGSLLIQMPAVVKNGLSLQLLWDLNDLGVRRVLASLLPIVFGLASGQIIALNLPRYLANAMPLQELASIGYANRLMQVPLDLLASGPAIALFPTLALLAAQKNLPEVRLQLSSALRRTLILTIAATALLAALRFPIIHLLLEHGKFDKAATKHTTPVLLAYAFCIAGLGAQQVLSRGFYALGDTKPPVVIGIIAIALFYFFNALSRLVPPTFFIEGAPRLALSAALCATFLGGTLWLSLHRKLGGWDDESAPHATRDALLKSCLAAFATYFVALFASRFALSFIASAGLDAASTRSVVKYAARAVALGFAALLGGGTFVLAARLLKLPWRTAAPQKPAPPDAASTRPENASLSAVNLASPREKTAPLPTGVAEVSPRKIAIRPTLRRSRFRAAKLPPREKPRRDDENGAR